MKREITKILIANRGEIACRVIRTARRMGIATVAVYSDADRDALHVRMADEAVHIGPAPAAESYLVIDKIIDAAKQTGADAVHPGYGFLSENPAFVRALDEAGITFIGPSATAIESMGLKDAAKDLMEAAGVPVTPGYRGENQEPEHLAKEAERIGYPVLIKAVAGGGGKGMRKVERAEDFVDALASCQREATASFGNGHVLIEKFVTSPRHIEVQVFGDSHGHVVHMFERDCSLQRRHQKVIEVAPAPGMTEDVRDAMTSAAVKAAQAVNYEGAGTVEFIVDGSGKLRTDGFWFMEMNTRLQVEHPVTEEITGLDLVEWQIRVARGESLPDQSDITMSGHAVEARLYAEDPAKDFAPSVGRIRCLDAHGSLYERSGYRIDTGFKAGDDFPVHYDPMIAKVIGYGDDRDTAIEKTIDGIVDTEVYPLKTNAAFLVRCLHHDDFEAGTVSTTFISERLDDLIGVDLATDPRSYALAAIYLNDRESRTPFGEDTGFRVNSSPRRAYAFDKNGQRLEVFLLADENDFVRATVDGEPVFISRTDYVPSLDEGDLLGSYEAWSFKTLPDAISLMHSALIGQVKLWHPTSSGAHTTPGALTAPMPGKVIAVNVAEGDAVTEGQTLVVLEAMKMEMAIKAPRDGVVASVPQAVGAMVGDGDVLVALEEAE